MPLIQRALIAGLVAFWALAVIVAAIGHVESDSTFLFAAASGGGLIAGLAIAAFFGRPGKVGWAWAFGAGYASTLLGGTLGGLSVGIADLEIGPFGGAMLGLFLAGSMPIGGFLTAAVWLLGVIGVHLTAHWLRLAGQPRAIP